MSTRSSATHRESTPPPPGLGGRAGPKRLPEFLDVLYTAHTDWVTQIQHDEETRTVLSSSMDGNLVVFDSELRAVRYIYEGHRLGIKGFCLCSSLGYVASYGLEREIHLWLLRTGTRVGSLPGLPGSVVHCTVNEELQQLMTLTVDAQVRLWDLKAQRLLQTLNEEGYERPEDRKVGTMCFDATRQRLLTFYNRPVAWNLKCTSQDTLGHTAPVTAVLYNPLFHSIVSCDEEGTVVVWDSRTSKPANRFVRTHGEGLPITAATFDVSKRKLLTASSDGAVRMWNFNNGQLLKEFLTQRTHEDREKAHGAASTSQTPHTPPPASSSAAKPAGGNAALSAGKSQGKSRTPGGGGGAGGATPGARSGGRGSKGLARRQSINTGMDLLQAVAAAHSRDPEDDEGKESVTNLLHACDERRGIRRIISTG
jgi:WD40 repeat protein